jgi:guanylate kinase
MDPVSEATRPERGVLAIVSSPSGAGKTTLTRRLLDDFRSRLEFSVSHTTRKMRPNEVEGRDYHFVSPAEFQEMIERGEFAEHAYVHGNRYGTAQAPVEDALARGKDMIFDVDWQGANALAARWPQDALKIFILPPSLDALAERLRTRATDDPNVIKLRLEKALDELGHFEEYSYLIVNDDVERAYTVLRAVYLTRRFGTVDRPDVPYSLAEMARVVEQNEQSGAQAHARRLVGRG